MKEGRPVKSDLNESCKMLVKDMTNFQSQQAWLGHNGTCYHNLKMFLHALL